MYLEIAKKNRLEKKVGMKNVQHTYSKYENSRVSEVQLYSFIVKSRKFFNNVHNAGIEILPVQEMEK